MDWGGIIVEIESDTCEYWPGISRRRTRCGIIVKIESDTRGVNRPAHGTVTANVPWAYPGSSFTKEFDRVVGWLAANLPRSTVSDLMRTDWEMVERCVQRTLGEIGPERARCLDGLVIIGIDETSYKKWHTYITVVVNRDTNTKGFPKRGTKMS